MAANDTSMIEHPQHPLLDLDYVLARFPFQSLLVCCCVSKPLLKLIKYTIDFAQLQYNLSQPQLMVQRRSFFCSNFHLVDLDTDTTSRVEVNPAFNLPLRCFDPAQSSNGLLLLEHTNVVTNVQRCIIFNPVTGEYVRLPETVYPCRNAKCAFFYTPKNNQYKVFRVFHRLRSSDATSCTFMELDPSSDSNLDSHSDTEIDLVSDCDGKLDLDSNSDLSSIYSDLYSTSDSDSDFFYSASDIMGDIFVGGSDSWESLGNLPFSPLSIYYPCHLDKTTHWLCEDKNVPSLIVFFNFETNQVGEIPGPAHINKSHLNAYDDVTLIVKGKCLSIFDGFTKEAKMDVWVMKDYGDQDSWSLEYVIDTTVWDAYGFDYSFRPLICRNNGEVVMVCADGYMIFYNLSKMRGRIVYHPPLVRPWNALVHTPSFISLSEVARGSNLELEYVASRFVDPGSNVLNYLELMETFPE